MGIRRTVKLTGIILIAGTLGVLSAIAVAADYNFAGTWKGEYTAAAPAAGTPAAPATTGRPGGGGGGGGGGFGASTGPQKITMRVKVNKEKDKATGNFTMGSSTTEDIREGRIAGNKLTFKTGKPPATIYDYDAVMIGEELSVTRTAADGRGGKPQLFTLKVSK